jgi:hypothetical protein
VSGILISIDTGSATVIVKDEHNEIWTMAGEKLDYYDLVGRFDAAAALARKMLVAGIDQK